MTLYFLLHSQEQNFQIVFWWFDFYLQRVWTLNISAFSLSSYWEAFRTSHDHTPFCGLNLALFSLFGVLFILLACLSETANNIYLNVFQAISIPLLSSYPYIALLSGITLHLVLNSASILRNTLSVSTFWY